MSTRSLLRRWILAVLAGCAGALGLSACGADSNGDQIVSPISTTVTNTVTTTASTRVASTTGTNTSAKDSHSRPVVLLGDMNTDEQFVLGELYLDALRAAGFRVALTRNIGPTPVTNEAIKQGTLSVFPDYLNNLYNPPGSTPRTFSSERDALAAARRYGRRHGLALLDPTPFSNNTGLAVTTQYAHSLHITSLGELARGPAPVVGVPLEWATSATGLPLFERRYKLAPTYVRKIGIGLQYKALQDGSIDVAYVNSTDPQLDSTTFTMLSDPQHVGGFGNVVPVTTAKVIAAEGPVFVRTLNRVDALLTLSAIRGLNAEVQLDGVLPATAAEEFLQANHIIPAPSTPGSD